MNTALLAFTAGSLITLAALLLVARRLPVQPRTSDVIARLDVHHLPTRATGPTGGPLRTRIGQALADNAPGIPGFTTPARDLDLLDIPAADFYARKAILALTGLLAPAVLTALMTAASGMVIVLPMLAAPLVGLVCWLQPDLHIRATAAARRREFTRFVTTYLELVAVALLGTTTADAALTAAATVSDSWVFTRIRAEYRMAEATRTTKWEALETLADTVGVAALGEMARIMRLSEAHMPIRDQLRAACDKLRAQTVTDDALTAERISNRMQAPIFGTILPVLALVLIPTALQLTHPDPPTRKQTPMPQPAPSMTPVAHRRARHFRDSVLRAQAWLQHRWALLIAEPESGMDDIPWKMILMIGGGVIAVGMVTAIVAFVHAQLAQLPTTPGF